MQSRNPGRQDKTPSTATSCNRMPCCIVAAMQGPLPPPGARRSGAATAHPFPHRRAFYILLRSSREYGVFSHPLCSSSAPPQTLRRRDLLVSKTMRVVLSWSKKVAFNKPMFGSDSCAKYSSYRSIWIERQKWRTHHIKTICIVYSQTFLLCYCDCGCCCAFLL